MLIRKCAGKLFFSVFTIKAITSNNDLYYPTGSAYYRACIALIIGVSVLYLKIYIVVPPQSGGI